MMSEEEEARRLWFRREVVPLEPELLAYASRLGRISEEDPEDLVQDVFAKLIRFDGWRSVDNVTAFCYRTLKNLALYAARRRRIVPIYLAEDMDALAIVDEAPGADRIAAARDELRLLERLIDALPPQCQRVFRLKKIEGLSNGQIAEMLGLSVSTVEKHVVKGLCLCSAGLAAGSGAASSRDRWSEAELTDANESAARRPAGSSVLPSRTPPTMWLRSRHGARKI